MGPIDMGILVRIGQAVFGNLNSAEVIGMLPDASRSEEREGYWERAFVVCWHRPDLAQHPTRGAFSYGTHLVHVNSEGDSACFMGNYDMERDNALVDMFKRAKVTVPAPEPTTDDTDMALALWFTPDAIRQHFEGDDDEYAKWVESVDDGELASVGYACIGADGLYKEFRELLKAEIKERIDA